MPSRHTQPTIEAGVISGTAYQALIHDCLQNHYALPAVNVSNINMINAALEAAAAHHSDIILQISHGGAQFYGGAGIKNTARARFLGAVSMAHHVHLVARDYGIRVILHTDHAPRSHLSWIDDLIEANQDFYTRFKKPLFSSHMIDLSTEPLHNNIQTARSYLNKLTPLAIGLEIELGITGGEEDGIGDELDDHIEVNPNLYTTPEDILTSWRSLAPHGMLSIAASFGNVHGVYRPGKVQLKPEILQKAQEALKQSDPLLSPIPFVFHGGSGSEIAEIRQAVSFGVFKMNLDTDTQFAFARGVHASFAQNPQAFQTQIDPKTGKPLKKFYDPRSWLREGERAYQKRLVEAFEVLGSINRSLTLKNT